MSCAVPNIGIAQAAAMGTDCLDEYITTGNGGGIVRNNKLTVNIYGTQTVPGKQVKMEVVELSRDPAKLKEVLDTSMAPGTYRISGSVYDGYKSQSYRVVYINGVEYSRTEEAISKYTRYDYTATKYYNPAPAGPETPQPGTGGGVAEGGNEPDPA